MRLIKDKVLSTKYEVLSTFIAILAMTACSQEAVEVDSPAISEEQSEYYLTLNITTPQQNRTRNSTTVNGDSGDTMEGTADETALVSAKVYFCVNNRIITSFDSDYIDDMQGASTTIRIKIDDKISELTDLAGKTAQVFVVGNTKKSSGATLYTPVMGGSDGKDISKATFSMGTTVEADPIGDFGNAGHLMPLVNAKAFEVNIPKTDTQSELDAIKAMFSRHTATISWWDIKDNNANPTLYLERGVARLEYKDQERTSADLPTEAHTYKIGNLNVNIELNTLTPFNVNTDSYLFRHTAPGTFAAAGEDIKLFGIENGGNNAYTWVASPWWSTGTPTFLNKLTVSSDSYSIAGGNGSINIATLDARVIDGDDYHPWCYVSENTLPSTALMTGLTTTEGTTQTANVVKYATGVAFKFIVLGKDGEPLQYESTPGGEDSNYPAEVTNSVTPEMPSGGKWITITDPSTQKWVDSKPETVTYDGESITAYTLTYIACIVHNDGESTGKDAETGIAPMYYGVVRNNTYQMSVKSIAGLPLPQEPRTLFLELDCKVLDWNVRKDPGITLY